MDSRRIVSKSSMGGIYTLLLTAFVLFALGVAQDILIPLALAVLLTFLVSPIVTRLEQWVGRVVAALTVVLMLLCFAGLTGWVLSHQLIDLGAKLPDYKGNIQTKVRSFKLPPGGVFSRLSQMVEELKHDLATEEPVKPPGAALEKPKHDSATGEPVKPPVAAPVIAVKANDEAPARPLEIARNLIAPLLGPLGTAGLVLLLLVFMLLQREDLRGRFIRLVGKGHIGNTTHAMDDAGQRVSRFLLMQLVINVTYGVAVAIGLSVIGIPSAILCGTLATVLRFIPYVGPWIAATIPILLSLAVFDNWTTPLQTIGLFVVLELLSNNLMEPLLYGSSTGVAPTALIVAAVFWTWLWGPVGLVLSTPLTVCLVVIGRHVPRLEFLSVLLSDDRPLTVDEECYHRLLAHNSSEAGELVDAYVKKNSIAALYDAMLIPVITRVELDEQADAIDDDSRVALLQSVRDLIDDMGALAISPTEAGESGATHLQVASVPARAERDELAATMLAQLLTQQGFPVDVGSAEMTAGELIEWTIKQNPKVICISVVPPTTLVHARFLCVKLRARLPEATIIIGLWNFTERADEAVRRLRASGANEVVMSLAEALARLKEMAGIDAEQGAAEADDAASQQEPAVISAR